uniref:hypothetical protein n=1 Tax=Herbidospora sakaeratensis TaxID=564415 RepID=UPI000AD0E5AA|nr:hypothetical protein [Herbidospora sakaeratensis]
MQERDALLVLVGTVIAIAVIGGLTAAGGVAWPLALVAGLTSGGVTFAYLWNLLSRHRS